MGSQGTYTDNFASKSSLENYITRPKNSYVNTKVGLKLLDQNNDVYFNKSDVSFKNKLLNGDPALTSLTAHAMSSNSAYAFAIAQILLTRDIINTLPVSISSSNSAIKTMFREDINTIDITNDNRLGIGQLGLIGIKKYEYGDFIRAQSFSAITNNGIMFKDTSSASKLHGLISRIKLASSTELGGSAYFIALDGEHFRFYNDQILIREVFEGPTSASCFNYNDAIISLYDGGVFSQNDGVILYKVSDEYAGLMLTASTTATQFECWTRFTLNQGVSADVAIIINSSTSLTANISNSNSQTGSSDYQYDVTHFSMPTSGSISAIFAVKNSACATITNFSLKESKDVSVTFWTLQQSVNKDEDGMVSRIVNDTNDPGWYIDRNGNSQEGNSNVVYRYYTPVDQVNKPGSAVSIITGSNVVNDGQWHLITMVRQWDNNFKFYFDETLEATLTSFNRASESEVAPLNIGAREDGDAPLRGQIGEFQYIRGYALNSTEISSNFNNGLSSAWGTNNIIAHYKWIQNGNSEVNNNVVGLGFINTPAYLLGSYPTVNEPASAGFIFYDLGIISIHGPNTADIISVTSLSSVEFSSTINLQTLTVFCSADTFEFNYPSNESAFYNFSVTADPNDDSSTSNYNFTLSGWQWGAATESNSAQSNFYLREMYHREPYITTIGLYDDNNDLLMVGKLTQPIKKPKSVPITIKLQYDF